MTEKLTDRELACLESKCVGCARRAARIIDELTARCAELEEQRNSTLALCEARCAELKANWDELRERVGKALEELGRRSYGGQERAEEALRGK